MPRREMPAFNGNPIPKIPQGPAYSDGRAYSLTKSPPGVTVSQKVQTETYVGVPDAANAFLENERQAVKGVIEQNKSRPQRQGRPY